jgi:hypothetical protein
VNKEELIWVSAEVAERFKSMESIEERSKAFDEYLEKVKEESKNEFKANLESLEEDVAIYTGLMLKVKQAFSKAKDEQLEASYAIWEKLDAEKPSIKKKTDSIVDMLKPITSELKEINVLIQGINTWNIKDLIESLRILSTLSGTNKEMLEFLVKNFTRGK